MLIVRKRGEHYEYSFIRLYFITSTVNRLSSGSTQIKTASSVDVFMRPLVQIKLPVSTDAPAPPTGGGECAMKVGRGVAYRKRPRNTRREVTH